MISERDYPQLTKFDKSKCKSLKYAIFEVTQKLESGISSPVPYDTAWVARIPEVNKSCPAFPESLQWLRDHQAKDGSWGTQYPFSIHSQMLNTFSAVLAFSQWSFKHDKHRISKGTQALKLMTLSLPQQETGENAFEMILSSFLDDARGFKLDLPYDKFEWFYRIGKENLKKISRELLSNKPNKHWSLIEAAGSNDLELASYRSEVARYGLIASQPSTTAFILRYARLRGSDFPEAEWRLRNLCVQHQGGIPHLVPIDNFEIINGLDFLFKAQINPKINVKYTATQNAIDLFARRIQVSRKIGFSSNWPIADSECTKTAFDVGRQICPERFVDTEKYFPKDELFTDFKFVETRLTSFLSNSVHLHDSIFQCKEVNIHGTSHPVNGTFMNCLHNVSFYYTLLQYIFATARQATGLFSEIELFLGKTQNSDGGWGDKTPSSAEETAYVCLSIFRLVQTRKEVLHSINFPKLVEFMNSECLPEYDSFWCYKVLFKPTVVTDTIITAAKYGIFQIQRLCMFTDAINDFKLDFFNVEYSSAHDRLLHQGTFLLTRPEVRRTDIEVSKTEVEEICRRVLESEEEDEYMQKLIDVSLDFSYWTNEYKLLPFDRAMDTSFIVFLFVFDDIIDCFLKGKEATVEIDELMKVPGKILRYHFQNVDTVPAFDLPRIDTVWKWCFNCRQMMEENNWNIESFANILERSLLKGLYQFYKLRSYGIEPTSNRYLEISIAAAGLEETMHYATLLQDKTVDSTQFDKDDLLQKYMYCSFKAARISSDVLSIFKDLRESQTDNYCIWLMRDYGISLADAMLMATKKSNKEILKMYSFKKMILKRDEKINDGLELVIKNIDRCANSCLRWSLDTTRYNLGHNWLAERVSHEKKDLTFIWELCFS